MHDLISSSTRKARFSNRSASDTSMLSGDRIAPDKSALSFAHAAAHFADFIPASAGKRTFQLFPKQRGYWEVQTPTPGASVPNFDCTLGSSRDPHHTFVPGFGGLEVISFRNADAREGRTLFLETDTVSTTARTDLTKLFVQIERFARLAPDWAGPETQPVPQRTLNLARRIIRALPTDLPLPQLSLSQDGELGFTWLNAPKKRLEALLQPDGHLVWVVATGTNIEYGLDLDLHRTDAKEFYKAIRAFLA